ncbi:hypothetical protein M9H77_08089 [Catharanthus roseus]|uniref:Uncharacterized protein n=1 Tax=Catharanthus roseus TaxID=4058 RepID=A0ACC0BX09_CATRO|nr:hypothetical protein M9H77_08089 [Catharanthus roseus]
MRQLCASPSFSASISLFKDSGYFSGLQIVGAILFWIKTTFIFLCHITKSDLPSNLSVSIFGTDMIKWKTRIFLLSCPRSSSSSPDERTENFTFSCNRKCRGEDDLAGDERAADRGVTVVEQQRATTSCSDDLYVWHNIKKLQPAAPEAAAEV